MGIKQQKALNDQNDGIVSSSRWFPTEVSRAEWLFRFMRADIGALTEGDLINLQHQAGEFAGGQVAPDADLVLERHPEIRPTVTALMRLQAGVRDGWNKLRADRWWISEAPVTRGIRRLGPRIIGGYRTGTFSALFLDAALEAVKQSWDRLYECRRCRSVFVKVWRQAYCSPACSQQERMERFRAKRPPRDYRGERQRAARKRTGAKVKLATRRNNR